MAMAAGPMTPIKDPNDQSEGGEQQDKEQAWEGMEPLGGAAAGQQLHCMPVPEFSHQQMSDIYSCFVASWQSCYNAQALSADVSGAFSDLL